MGGGWREWLIGLVMAALATSALTVCLTATFLLLT